MLPAFFLPSPVLAPFCIALLAASLELLAWFTLGRSLRSTEAMLPLLLLSPAVLAPLFFAPVGCLPEPLALFPLGERFRCTEAVLPTFLLLSPAIWLLLHCTGWLPPRHCLEHRGPAATCLLIVSHFRAPLVLLVA